MRPRVIVHNMTSIDGRITGFDIDMETYYGLVSTWSEDATLAGSDTILSTMEEIPPETPADMEPVETGPDDARSIMAIIDSGGRVRIWHILKQFGAWKGYVALVSETTPVDYLDYLAERHIDHIVCGPDKVDVSMALEMLNERYGVETVRADSGGTLNGILIERGLVDEVSVLVSPHAVGGEASKTMFDTDEAFVEGAGMRLELFHFEKLKNGIVWLRYNVKGTDGT